MIKWAVLRIKSFNCDEFMSSLCSTMESSSNSFICCFGQVRIVWSIKKMKELELDSIVEHREELLISSQQMGGLPQQQQPYA